MYIDKPLKEYLDDVAAKKASPGGGSASALVAAAGTSLMSMAANFTIGKPEYKVNEDRVADILLKTKRFDSDLRALIDADVDAYKRLSVALNDAGSHTFAEMEELYKDAAEPPLQICEIVGKCMRLCRSLAGCGNKNLITDIAIAAIFFEAALLSAKFNVYVNLKHVKDMDYIAKVHNALTALEREMPKLKEEILEICENEVSS